MSFDVDEEQIFPQRGFARAAFELGHGNARFGKRLQQRGDGAGAVGRGDCQRGFVFAAAACILMPHDQEARGVVRLVFDTLGDIVQMINIGCGTPCDGGDTGVV